MIKDQPRRDAEIHEVREAVELGAETRRALDHARDTAVDRIQYRGEHDRADRQFVAFLEREANAGQAGAKREQRDDVRHEPTDRNFAQTLELALAAFRIEARVRHAPNITDRALPGHRRTGWLTQGPWVSESAAPWCGVAAPSVATCGPPWRD